MPILPGRARRKYSELDFALGAVGQALENAESLISRQAAPLTWSYQIPSNEDLRAAFRSATSAVETLRRSAKEFEVELLACVWE